jgi:cobalt/nickel transport system permease protein
MHLTTAMLSPSMITATSIAGAAAFALAATRLPRELDRRNLPTALALGGLVLVAQAVNVPLLGGFSGHLVGAALIALLLGPWTAMVSLGVILALQAVLLGDGSPAALGANFLTMGVVAAVTATGIARGARDRSPALRIGMASYGSTVLAALFLSLCLGGQAVLPLLATHAVIGLWEAGLTTALVLMIGSPAIHAGGWQASWIRATAALLLFAALFPLSSQLPDGLHYSWELLNR